MSLPLIEQTGATLWPTSAPLRSRLSFAPEPGAALAYAEPYLEHVAADTKRLANARGFRFALMSCQARRCTTLLDVDNS